jgi:hypothetical protein
MDAKLIEYTAQYLRGRAQQTRVMGRTCMCDATLAMLETRAAEYDHMAELKEKSAGPETVIDGKVRFLKRPGTRSNAKRVG